MLGRAEEFSTGGVLWGTLGRVPKSRRVPSGRDCPKAMRTARSACPTVSGRPRANAVSHVPLHVLPKVRSTGTST